jgi:hypothetical protein
MDLVRVIITILVIFAIISLINMVFKNENRLSSFNDGNVEMILPSSKMVSSTSTNYTYSIWFYVEDWNYKYGQQKVLLQRLTSHKNPCPRISLGSFQNDLTVAVQTYPNTDVPGSSKNTQTFNCTVKNVPIQSWVNALISVNGRTLDVYLDGKLVKTCVMPGVAVVAQNTPVVITPNGGFSGFTSNIEYWAKASTPQEAWNIYRKGHGGGNNIFNKYKIKVAVLEDNREKASYQAPY